MYDPYISAQSYCIKWPLQINYTIVNDTFAPLGRLGCNIPQNLFSKALLKIKAELQKLSEIKNDNSIILIPGDVIGHSMQYLKTKDGYIDPEFNKMMIKKTFDLVFNEIVREFKQYSVFYTLGNADTWHDYTPPIGDLKQELYQYIYQYIPKLANCELDTSIYNETATYSAQIYDKLILNINSNYFDEQTDKPEYNEIADQIIVYIKQKLSEIQNQDNIKAILNFHIAEGFYWKSDYSNQFLGILKFYESKIDIVINGHQHHNLYVLFQEIQIPIQVNQAISPIFWNYPGFKIYQMKQKEITFQDYFYNLDINNWIIGCDSSSLAPGVQDLYQIAVIIQEKIQEDLYFFEKLVRCSYGWLNGETIDWKKTSYDTKGTTIEDARKLWVCRSQSKDRQEFDQCINKERKHFLIQKKL